MKINKDNIIVVFLFLIIVSITFYQLITGQNVLVSTDNLSPLAFKQAVSKSLINDFSYPLWAPWLLGGMPTIHSLLNISDSYYLHSIISNMITFFNIPWIWNFLFHIIFGSFGMYKFLQYLNVSKYSSFIISSSFFLMPYFVAMLAHGHGSQVMTACYIPWIMWCLFKIVDDFKILDLSFLALFIGLQLQRGHIQIAYYTWMMIGLFILLKITFIFLNNRNNFYIHIKKYLFLFFSLIGGVLLSLNLYYPILNYTEHSIRGMNDGGAGILYATQWSLSFKEALTFIYPSIVGFGGVYYQGIGTMPFTDYPNYFGIILFLFSIIGFLKSDFKNHNNLFFLLVVIFSFLLSLGKNFIDFYSLFYNYFPYFNKFRAPVFILVIFNFALSIYAAFGVDYIAEKIKNNKKYPIFYYTAFSLMIIVYLIYLISQIFIPSDYNFTQDFLDLLINDLILLLLMLFVSIIILYLFKKIKINYLFFYLFILLLIVYDLTRVNHEIINPTKHIPNKKIMQDKQYLDNYLTADDATNFILSDNDIFRIYDPIGLNRWSAFNVENILGYHPAKLSMYEKLKRNIESKNYNIWPIGILKLLNVKYLLFPHNPNTTLENKIFSIIDRNVPMYFFGGHPTYDGKLISIDILELNEKLPRFFFTKNINYINNENEIYDLIITDTYDPYEISYLSSSNINKNILFKSDNPIVTINKWTPNEILFTTETKSKQFLVMSEAYFPYGWTLKDDSISYNIYQVNNFVRGFFVPIGKHSFIMKFEPRDVLIGKIISLLSLLLILSIIFYYCKREKNV